jgi:hypothetical protein
MTSTYCNASANVMMELYFQWLDKLSLRTALDRVPFNIQQRRTGFTPAMRCMTLLAGHAQRVVKLTDWTARHRRDSRLEHWLGDRPAPHYSTLSRTLAACDQRTVRALRAEVLAPLTEQVLLSASGARGRRVFLDVDNKGLVAEGPTHEGATFGRMSDGQNKQGYRLHLISLANCWPLEMEWTGAHAHAVPSAMMMVKRLMGRLPDRLRGRVLFRGDSSHGCVRFIRFLNRYAAGYLLKNYRPETAERLWQEAAGRPTERIVRPGRPDLLAIELGSQPLHGKRAVGRSGRRTSCWVRVDRVVVYREQIDPTAMGRAAQCFALLTTLPADEFDAAALYQEAYLPRAGDIENIFCQLDQAFQITHLRSRSFYGNWTFVMLSLVAATLTQMIRQDDRLADQPMPAGLEETLVAAASSGLSIQHSGQAGCVLAADVSGSYQQTFQAALACSYQYRFRYVA